MYVLFYLNTVKPVKNQMKSGIFVQKFKQSFEPFSSVHANLLKTVLLHFIHINK